MAAKKKPVEQVRSHTRRNHKHGTKPNPNQVALCLDDVKTPNACGFNSIGVVPADEVLEIARDHITTRSEYDSKAGTERSFKRTAATYNALTGANLSGSDVAMLLTCLKLVRAQTAKESGRAHIDSAVDGAAYLSFFQEELQQEVGQ